MIRLSQIVLFSRDLQVSKGFYSNGLGLSLAGESETFLNYTTNKDTTIAVKLATTESVCSTGYFPILSFQVDDLSNVVTQALHFGGHLDGRIQYPTYGKVASLRSPDGAMIALFEPNATG